MLSINFREIVDFGDRQVRQFEANVAEAFRRIREAQARGDIGPTLTFRRDIYTASGTWTCPEGVTSVVVRGWGGGGGGAGGQGGSKDSNSGGLGGGGGGAAVASAVPLTVVPGTTYAVGIGAGGSAGTAGKAGGGDGGRGGDGGDTTFGSLARFVGAQGGWEIVDIDLSQGGGVGGAPSRLSPEQPPYRTFQLGAGGSGGGDASSLYGALRNGGTGAVSGSAPTQTAGTTGAFSGARMGGGGGGCGGWSTQAIVAHSNAAGGNGGAGNNAGAGGNGTTPAAPAANSGDGGGGGGGGGSGSTAGGAGGAGAAGASGWLAVEYWT